MSSSTNGTNGGIVGTVFYDTMRAEDDARYAGAEPWQPGIPDLTMNLYATVKNARRRLRHTRPMAPTGRAQLLAATSPRTTCAPRTASRSMWTAIPSTSRSLPPASGGYDCLEGPPMGIQFGARPAELHGN